MAEVFTRASISTDYAHELVGKAEQKAGSIGVPSVVAIVDESGVTKLISRMDGAPLSSVQVAQDKAYSAAATGAPTDMWYGVAQQDPSFGFGLPSIDRLCPIGGGFPIQIDGKVVGAIGVSGGSVDQDVAVASAALGKE